MSGDQRYPSIMEAIKMGECPHWFHYSTARGFCRKCGKAWKWRHRADVGGQHDQ